MNIRHGFGLLLASLGLALPLSALHADVVVIYPQPDIADSGDKRSHVPIPRMGGTPESLKKLLDERLRDSRDLADLEKLAELVLKDPEKYLGKDQGQGLQGRIPRELLNDPKMRELLGRMVEKHQRDLTDKSPGLSPDRLKELQEKYLQPSENGRHRPLPDPGAKKPEPDKTPADSKPPDSSGPKPDGPKPDAAEQKSPSPLVRQWTRSIEGKDNSSGKAGGWLRDLGKSALKDNARNRSFSSGLQERWPGLSKQLGFDRSKSYSPSSWRRDFSLPKWSPSGNSSSGNRTASVSAPKVSGGLGGSALWQGLLWLAVAVAAGLVLWRVLAWRGSSPPSVLLAGWQLGPWPLHPAAVRTRAELVRAFEYLSLLLLGPAARNLNHRTIAARLGVAEAGVLERRQAADSLASIYEQARYAPPHDPLPDADLAAARRDLCYLAGVPAA